MCQSELLLSALRVTLQSVTGRGDAIGGDLVERLSTGGAAELSWATKGSRCVVTLAARFSGPARCEPFALAAKGQCGG